MERLKRCVFSSPVIDPGGAGASTVTSFHETAYDLSLDRLTGLVVVTHRQSRRTVEAYVPCSFELAEVRAEPAPPPVAAKAPIKAAKK